MTSQLSQLPLFTTFVKCVGLTPLASFVEKIKEKLGAQAIGRRAVEAADAYELKEPEGTYKPHFGGKMGLLRPENAYSWNDFVENSTG